MFTVALIGPDGVGKTTVAKALEKEFPLPLKYLYMGDNVDYSNVTLPTTRWWKQRQRRRAARAAAAPAQVQTAGAAPGAIRALGHGMPRRARRGKRGLVRPLRKALGFVNRILEESYREAVSSWYRRRGTVVLFDRHFILDYYHFDIQPSSRPRALKRRLHGWLLRHISRAPDLVVCLDAPGEVVFARKGEFSPEFLEMRRQQYLEFGNLVKNFVVVDANRELWRVVNEVGRAISRFHEGRRAGRAPVAPPGGLRAAPGVALAERPCAASCASHAVRRSAADTSSGTRAGSSRGGPPAGATILVTDAGRGSAIAIIRSLGRSGYRVLAADSSPGSLGFHSRYTARSFVYPDPRTSPEAFRAAIRKLVVEQQVGLVIPVTDLTLQPLAAARDAFAALTRLAIPPPAALAVATDKALTLELAERLGVPVPPTRLVHTSEEAIACAEEWGWPLVLKPQMSHKLAGDCGIDSFQVTYAESPAELRAKLARFEGTCGVLLQRYCAGAGQGVELLMSRGRPLAAFQHRRRREIPLSGGASSYRESMALDPELCAHAVRLLAALEWTGLAMVEFKVDGERAELMEINGRVWGSLPLAVASGVDFPSLLARLYLDGEESMSPQLTSGYRLGLRCRDLQRDLLWIAAVLGRRQQLGFMPLPSRLRAVQALLGMFNPRRKMDLLVADDPLPGLLELPRVAPRLWAKVRQATATPLAASADCRAGGECGRAR